MIVDGKRFNRESREWTREEDEEFDQKVTRKMVLERGAITWHELLPKSGAGHYFNGK